MHSATLQLWIVFTAMGLFAIVYKAVMSSGSELTPWRTTAAYLREKSITTLMRFFIAQFGYFFIISNPAMLGDLLGVNMIGKVTLAPFFVAGMLGLASDKVADMFIVAGTWIYKKVESIFGATP